MRFSPSTPRNRCGLAAVAKHDGPTREREQVNRPTPPSTIKTTRKDNAKTTLWQKTGDPTRLLGYLQANASNPCRCVAVSLCCCSVSAINCDQRASVAAGARGHKPKLSFPRNHERRVRVCRDHQGHDPHSAPLEMRLQSLAYLRVAGGGCCWGSPKRILSSCKLQWHTPQQISLPWRKSAFPVIACVMITSWRGARPAQEHDWRRAASPPVGQRNVVVRDLFVPPVLCRCLAWFARRDGDSAGDMTVTTNQRNREMLAAVSLSLPASCVWCTRVCVWQALQFCGEH